VAPELFQLTKNQMQVNDLNGIPLLSTREVSIQGWNFLLKRASDLIFASIIALLALPLAALIALAIKLDSVGPVLYSQTRVGKNGASFRCYKFRTMVVGADDLRGQLANLNEATGPLFKVRNDPRRTRVGRFLRHYSLDELPQLINVFRGEMSVVGPRPNLPEEVERYEEWHKKRLTTSPGITGLWQVSGRSDLTFDEMVLLDIYYVEKWSLTLDMSILLRSIPAVLRGRGAY
jgi:exopolysaccharide biosynthesis polyprenyl glycosylphosphotransferase